MRVVSNGWGWRRIVACVVGALLFLAGFVSSLLLTPSTVHQMGSQTIVSPVSVVVSESADNYSPPLWAIALIVIGILIILAALILPQRRVETR